MIRRDRGRFGGGLIFYISKQFLSNFLALECVRRNIELILLDFIVKNRKWLCTGLYPMGTSSIRY